MSALFINVFVFCKSKRKCALRFWFFFPRRRTKKKLAQLARMTHQHHDDADDVGMGGNITLGLLEQFLYDAIRQDDLKEFRLRLKHGAKVRGPQCRDPDTGTTPLHLSILCGRVKMSHELLKHGADPAALDRAGRNALHLACRCRNYDIAKTVIEHAGDINSTTTEDNGGYTPLHFVAQYCLGDVGENLAALLLEEHQANPETLSALGESSLHICAKFDNDRVAKVILSNRNKTAQQHQGLLSPLTVCAARNSTRVSNLLIKNGENVFSPGTTCPKTIILKPLNVARQYGNVRLAKTMREQWGTAEKEREEKAKQEYTAALDRYRFFSSLD
uniref:Uncharacterized protein n=1 Tax=Mucochytrium quahogii TaxID=96639 RepID=A0A7S2SKP0_9STRA|mmetsp:Transcript_17507/g.28336  ORF Transcript_17507/g.28336 Transcript_17507/m.28336 type:complete len:331 (+) Transcript_17507:2-994(+)